MKIHILFNFQEGPWGGGNQFLKALREEWRRIGIYCENADEADVILFNSYPFREEYLFDELFRLKKKNPKTIVIYRLNGPISHIRQTDKEVDQMIACANRQFVDGIIFQSNWCAHENEKHFGITSRYQTVIYNAPDQNIFYKKKEKSFDPNHIKLIATSWSTNLRKGFDVYEFLDKNLDFSKYEMTFVGNSPIKFQNIRAIPAVASEQLASILREHDLFITGSKSDPCSNSLIEALSCGLPAVALNDGGHPELIQNGGLLFEGISDVIEKIEQVASNLTHFQSNLPVFDLSDIAQKYVTFVEKIYRARQSDQYLPKQVGWMNFLLLKKQVFFWKTKRGMKMLFHT